jgi:hypothetical protein
MTDPETIIGVLEHSPAVIVPLVREVPTAYLKRPPEPGQWSVHEHACHLAEVHWLFSSRLDLMLAETNPTIKPYFPEDEEVDKLLKMDLDEALERFTRDRAQLVARLKQLSPAEWQRTGVHGQYSRYSVFIMFRHLALHDMDHAYQIEAILLKKEWPQ